MTQKDSIALAIALLKECRSTLEMWKDVAPAVSLCADIDAALSALRAQPASLPRLNEAQIDRILGALDPSDGGMPEIEKFLGDYLRAQPAGWKLVPIEPTEAMCEAAMWCTLNDKTGAEIVRKAIEAAPTPPGQEQPAQPADFQELAKVYASSYASPHHITFTTDGLRNFVAALPPAQPAEKPAMIWGKTPVLINGDKFDLLGDKWWLVPQEGFEYEIAVPQPDHSELARDKQRLDWLESNCVRQVSASMDGPAFQQLEFAGKIRSDWTFDVGNMPLREAIDRSADALEGKHVQG